MQALCALPWRCRRHRAFPRGTGHLRTPSIQKITSVATISPSASLFLRPATITLKKTRQNASYRELPRLARAPNPPSARVNCTRGAGRGANIVRHHGVVVQEAVGREGGHLGPELHTAQFSTQINARSSVPWPKKPGMCEDINLDSTG